MVVESRIDRKADENYLWYMSGQFIFYLYYVSGVNEESRFDTQGH